jgi:hypothetical protein
MTMVSNARKTGARLIRVRHSAVALSLMLGTLLSAASVHAAEICIDDINGVQMSSDVNGALSLAVYSRQVMAMTANAYLFFSGNNETAKVFQAQFLAAKASAAKVCVSYVPGTPAYRWIMSSVGVADQDGWPWQ